MEDQTLEQSQEAITQGEGVLPKFQSAEEQAKAYQELERKATTQAQELAEMRRQMEDFKSTVDMRQAPVEDSRPFTEQYKSQDELKKFWERFAQKPQEVLSEFAQQVEERVERRNAVRELAKDSIAEFRAANPDLAPYSEIVSIFVNRQPTNLSPKERLERAAPEARKMIAQIAQKNGAPAPTIDAATYVEAPTSGSRGAPAPVKKESNEDALAEYLRESSIRQAKQQTPPRVTK